MSSFAVSASHPALPGHFPGEPLVPAVLLVDLATETARAALGLGSLTGVTRAKFIAPIRPEQRIFLRFTARGSGAVTIAGTRDGDPVFTIEAVFAEAPGVCPSPLPPA